MALFLIILTTFLISLISFIGAITLFLKEKILNKILLVLIAFSAGSLLGDAFFHLIPEAINGSGEKSEKFILNIFLYLIFGFCTFFILEDFISWHHHHETRHPEIKSFSYLILFSDAVHNLIDGLIVGASFVVSLPLGIASAIAIMSHEVPQEIGDFSLLIYGGFKKQ
jgi:zinc and cadmium transporter